MSNKIILSFNKTLKLINVISKEISESDLQNYEQEAIQMENYIRAKGAIPCGPLVQHATTSINEDGQIKIRVVLMRQSNTYINHLDKNYKMNSVLRIYNCIYVRYTGPEEKLKFAYDKINLTAFEEDIPINGSSYTIFVDQRDDNLIADVFMERADDEQTD